MNYTKRCGFFTVRIEGKVGKDELLQYGFKKIGEGEYLFERMINHALSIQFEIQLPKSNVEDEFEGGEVRLIVIDEDYLQYYHPTWSAISVKECLDDIMKTIILPEKIKIDIDK